MELHFNKLLFDAYTKFLGAYILNYMQNSVTDSVIRKEKVSKFEDIHQQKPYGGGRNISVDILRLIAAIIIVNSHMDRMYPGSLSFLATGGAIGDALFFFISGFTLFLKPTRGVYDFPNWYKRRINRVYPTVFAVAIIGCVFFHVHRDIIEILFNSGWFVTCIMVYYIFIYFIGSYFKKHILSIIALLFVLTAIWFSFEYKTPGFSVYALKTSNICLLFYFIFMLFGAYLGSLNHKPVIRPKYDLSILLLSLFSYYFLLYLGARLKTPVFQYFSLFALLAVVYYMYNVFFTHWAQRIYNSKTAFYIIRFIGGLCLEIYLLQGFLITDKFNHLFPLNNFLVLIAIIVLSYFTRCFARFLSQTFKDDDYNWKKIVDIL